MKKLNLSNLFEYCDGELYWKSKPKHGHIKVGDKAGWINALGYKYVGAGGKHHRLHRVIFFMHHGYLPDVIDHIDGDILNNRIENLRPATHTQNMRNTKLSARNNSGVKGVNWDKKSNKWRVHISVDGKTKTFGRFKDMELAELIAIEARNKYYGEFARHK